MFKVGDTVILTKGTNPLRTYVDWAQELMTSKARCKVIEVRSGSLSVAVLEGKEKGREVSSVFERFIKINSLLEEAEEL